jgi:cytochrome d ubiquinol oxidase subunit I
MAAAVLDSAADLVGDLHGLNTLEHQPAKVAAMEGIWQTEARRTAAAVRRADEKERAQPPTRSAFPKAPA